MLQDQNHNCIKDINPILKYKDQKINNDIIFFFFSIIS